MVVPAVLVVIGWLVLGAVNGFTDAWCAWLHAGSTNTTDSLDR